MRFSKPLIAAALAASMSSAPVLAQSAAPLSVATRSAAPMQDANQYRSQYLLPALVIIAVLAAAILLGKSNNDNPHSP
jgi:hypothetical protein